MPNELVRHQISTNKPNTHITKFIKGTNLTLNICGSLYY